MGELSAAAVQPLRSVDEESMRRNYRMDSRALARGRKSGVAAGNSDSVRSLQIATALECTRNFRAVSAWADTARNLDQHCIVAFDATMQGGQWYEQEKRDI